METPTFDHPSRFAELAPSRPAVVRAETGDVLTYGDLEARANRVAHLLRRSGLGVGSHVAVLMENSLEYFEVVWGALRAGVYIVPINWHLTATEVRYIVADCEPDAIFVSSALAHLAPELGERPRFVVGEGSPPFTSLADATADLPDDPIDDPSEGSWMFYSSGTTGRPKGIKPAAVGEPLGRPTPFGAFLRSLYSVSESTKYLSPAPLYHAAPAQWCTALHRMGATVVVSERFEPAEFLRSVQDHGITHTQLVPTHLVRLLKLPEEERTSYDLSSLEVVVHAAAPCPVEVKRAILRWMGPIVHEFYSGSEGVGFCAIGPEEWIEHPGSVGRSLMGAVHIVDEDGNELPAGEEGQVWFETQKKFEYHRDPEKSATAFDHRGWSTLGEIGRVDADGYLYLTDRASNMIISGGVNVYPREVEDVLIVHDAVADVTVVGIPDDDLGEAVRALVELVDPSAASEQLVEELLAHCRDHLAGFKCPRSMLFVDELPRLPTGKVARRLLPEEWLEPTK